MSLKLKLLGQKSELCGSLFHKIYLEMKFKTNDLYFHFSKNFCSTLSSMTTSINFYFLFKNFAKKTMQKWKFQT